MDDATNWHNPGRPEVCLTHRQIRFLRAPSEAAQRAAVVVGISHRNQPEYLLRALQSVMKQDMPADEVVCLILDDSSDAGWTEVLEAWQCSKHALVVADGRFGSPAQARNALLDVVDQHFPSARWVARLDADDEFAEPRSLRALVEAGDRCNCDYVVGSNRLRVDGTMLARINRACDATLRGRRNLLEFIEAFCHQRADNELPSCNLLLRTRAGIRYPNARSAEDHWLVAALLMHWPDRGAVVSEPEFAIYSLTGAATASNRHDHAWLRSRRALAGAAKAWYEVHEDGHHLLGWGQEGVVYRCAEGVIKRFYPHSIAVEALRAIQGLARQAPGSIIDFEILGERSGTPCIRLEDRLLKPLQGPLSDVAMQRFLTTLYRARVVTSNIKRDNLMASEAGELVYIDIGQDIVELTASRFLDCAARLYALGRLGWSDHELARRRTRQSQVEALSCLEGFERFYRAVVESANSFGSLDHADQPSLNARFDHDDVTLMLKACAQDWECLEQQTRHLTGELRTVLRFAKMVLLVDPHMGPYLRQHSKGDFSALRRSAEQLVQQGWLDEVWVADCSPESVSSTYTRWFGQADTLHTHTRVGAPLFPQLWGFDQVETRYVLQADIDVMVCLTDRTHDVLADMKSAMADPTVWCVGFNIPKVAEGRVSYRGEPEQFAPEVRFGLLDLHRIREHRPYDNPLSEDRYEMMWHRALQAAQPALGMRSVRGGDSGGCYIHPRNDDKRSDRLAIVRDLFSQGIIPTQQRENWDLVPGPHWAYPKRSEDVVILALGRDTPPEKLRRFLRSLERQTRQDFGVILVDDGGTYGSTLGLHRDHKWLSGRLTMIRRSARVGYLENFRQAVREICLKPESLIVVLDQDDALIGTDVVERLWAIWQRGADLIHGPMFRPDKPMQLYPVDYTAPRAKGGGNVWAHLRAFRKSLYERVPPDCLHDAPDPDCLSDFLTMVPMAELAHSPVFMDGPYLYLHDRLPYDDARKQREAKVKTWLFQQPALRPASTDEKSESERLAVASPTC